MSTALLYTLFIYLDPAALYLIFYFFPAAALSRPLIAKRIRDTIVWHYNNAGTSYLNENLSRPSRTYFNLPTLTKSVFVSVLANVPISI